MYARMCNKHLLFCKKKEERNRKDFHKSRKTPSILNQARNKPTLTGNIFAETSSLQLHTYIPNEVKGYARA